MEKAEKKYKILVVDDIVENIKVVTEILNPYYENMFAINGGKALELVELDRPDLILLDIMMPEMDGFEVCNVLKSSKETQEIPIIFLTARDKTESIVKGFETGAVDYVTKPFNPPELLTRIRTHLKLSESTKIIAQKNKELAEFLQILCHDFMTPISFVLGCIKLIKEDRSLYDEFQDDIEESMLNALSIMDLVRTMRKLDDFDNQLDLFPVHLKPAVEQSIQLLKHRFNEKNIHPVVNISNNETVIAEETSLVNSVINNILTNAIKFSYTGDTVDISSQIKEDMIYLKITDQGMGIPEKMLGILFDVSKQTSRIGTAGESGTGFGMLLINKFIKAYGGKLDITSKEKKNHPTDHGTTITIGFKKA